MPTRFKLPEILIEPVNVCVFAVLLPNTLLPELNTTEELTVVTTRVCAVKVPLIKAAEAVIAPKIFWLPVNMFEPVVAYVLSICVTLVEKDPDAT